MPVVCIHDLSHSFASTAVAAGQGLPMIGKLLAHSQVQTTCGSYKSYLPPKTHTVGTGAARTTPINKLPTSATPTARPSNPHRPSAPHRRA